MSLFRPYSDFNEHLIGEAEKTRLLKASFRKFFESVKYRRFNWEPIVNERGEVYLLRRDNCDPAGTSRIVRTQLVDPYLVSGESLRNQIANPAKSDDFIRSLWQRESYDNKVSWGQAAKEMLPGNPTVFKVRTDETAFISTVTSPETQRTGMMVAIDGVCFVGTQDSWRVLGGTPEAIEVSYSTCSEETIVDVLRLARTGSTRLLGRDSNWRGNAR